jgi:paired amphipathic helix protein Sin3a
LSEIDLGQIRPEDRVSSSYYRIPEDFPIPISSGKVGLAAEVMNDIYCSIVTGSENFKFKQKYEYEDNLFKNEDAMYSIDHIILQYQTVLNQL